MNILVLDPGGRTLNYSLFLSPDELVASAAIGDYRKDTKPEVMQQIKANLARAGQGKFAEPDIVAIRVFCGGDLFTGPVSLNDQSLRRLKQLIPQAPFHIPAVLGLAEAAKGVFLNTEVVFVFETTFFLNLPARERICTISPETTPGAQSQRLGFHGLMHEAACRQAGVRMNRDGFTLPAKTVSICLDSRPEVAAAVGMRPVMVTGGVTPLEGLPGDTSCGDLDIGIIIKIGHELDWGPEQINQILTGESGISGLLRRRITLGEVFASTQKDCRLVQKFILYKLLQACGAALAAMGSIDSIIFSGKYGSTGQIIGPWLLSQLGFMSKKDTEPRLHWEIMEQPVERIIAEIAKALVTENHSREIFALR
jgi:acetate kinase